MSGGRSAAGPGPGRAGSSGTGPAGTGSAGTGPAGTRPTGTGPTGTGGSGERPPVVDAHTHFFPPSLIELARSGDGPSGIRVERRDGAEWFLQRGHSFPLDPVLYDLERRVEQLDRDGIDAAVVAVVANLFGYELPPAETLELCRLANDAAARLVDQLPGRLFAMCSVPLNDPPAAAAELRRARHELGLVGVEIGPSVEDVMLDDPSLDPFWAAAAELRMPVMLHPYVSALGDGRAPRGTDGYHLANVIGNMVETTTAGFRLIVGGVFDRHPDLLVQLSHGGGFVPYQLGRLEHAYAVRADTSAGAARTPSAYLGNFLFDTVVFQRDALDFLLTRVGSERVLFGTDIPFDMNDSLALAVARGEERPAWAEAVLSGNARRAYGLGEITRGPF